MAWLVGVRSPAVGIEYRPAIVVRQLQPAPLVARDAVKVRAAAINEYRQAVVGEPGIAGGCAKEEDFLARRLDAITDHIGKEFAQPGSTSEDVVVGLERGSIREQDAGHTARGNAAGLGVQGAEFSALGFKAFEHGFAGAARL